MASDGTADIGGNNLRGEGTTMPPDIRDRNSTQVGDLVRGCNPSKPVKIEGRSTKGPMPDWLYGHQTASSLETQIRHPCVLGSDMRVQSRQTTTIVSPRGAS
jgi:hypothetical protein